LTNRNRAHVPLADVLDLDSLFPGQSICVLSQLVAERLRETRVVEDPYCIGVQIRGDTLGKTNAWQGAKHPDSVVAGENTADLVGVSFGQ
jgi:hypothetical protein